MRIISWNCSSAFRKKAEAILEYRPDILVVPECECPENLKFPEGIEAPGDLLWFGSNKHKGLGVFAYGKYHLSVSKNHNPAFRFIVPIIASGNGMKFTLFAIWANNPEDTDGRYVEQIWKAINYYKRQIGGSCILIGDFNSNTIWDRKRRVGNHSDVVKFLASKNVHSAYHEHFSQTQGKERHSTLYMYRQKDKAYHIDYCFLSEDLLGSLENVEIGHFKKWMRHSDHVPVIITLRSES